jgi:LPXTG-motif cell wall-anchored protein
MGEKSAERIGRLVARVSGAALMIASIAFAAPSYAVKHDTGQAHVTQGQAHKQVGQHEHAAAQARRDRVGDRGGSTVGLARPNGFQAQGDPDGMHNGGVDQPGGQGGLDTTTQDGNNGSGNDADCEDDNNGVGIPGRCKVRPGHLAPASANARPHPGAGTSGTDVRAPGGDLAGPVIAPASSAIVGWAVQVDASGTSAASTPPARARFAPAAGVLPNTGAGQVLLGLALAGLAALAVGGGLLRQGRGATRVAD